MISTTNKHANFLLSSNPKESVSSEILYLINNSKKRIILTLYNNKMFQILYTNIITYRQICDQEKDYEKNNTRKKQVSMTCWHLNVVVCMICYDDGADLKTKRQYMFEEMKLVSSGSFWNYHNDLHLCC